MCVDITEWINKKNHTGTREIEKPVSISLNVSVLRRQRYVLSPALARISPYITLCCSPRSGPYGKVLLCMYCPKGPTHRWSNATEKPAVQEFSSFFVTALPCNHFSCLYV